MVSPYKYKVSCLKHEYLKIFQKIHQCKQIFGVLLLSNGLSNVQIINSFLKSIISSFCLETSKIFIWPRDSNFDNLWIHNLFGNWIPCTVIILLNIGDHLIFLTSGACENNFFQASCRGVCNRKYMRIVFVIEMLKASYSNNKK